MNQPMLYRWCYRRVAMVVAIGTVVGIVCISCLQQNHHFDDMVVNSSTPGQGNTADTIMPIRTFVKVGTLAIPTDIYLPALAPVPSSATVIVVPGFMSTKEQHHDQAQALTAAGCIAVVISPRYSLVRADLQARIAEVTAVLDYLERENGTQKTELYGRIDTQRIGIAGHSAGGLTALGVAAIDPRIKALVGLDIVVTTGPRGGMPAWEPRAEGAKIAMPVLLVTAPPSACNAYGNNGMPVIDSLATEEKRELFLANGSHCDFLDANPACDLICGGSTQDRREFVISAMVTFFQTYLNAIPSSSV
jgi:dienelactone hydrolase